MPLKRIKRKEKLELLGSCAKKGKPDLSENNMLKKVFNALNLLFMPISGSHSSNPRLSSHETPILNNFSVWMRKGSYGWVFALLVLDLILSIFVGGPFMHWMSHLHAFCASCIFVCIVFVLILLLCFSFVWVKNLKPHKKWKIQKVRSYMFKHIWHVCLALYLCTNGFVNLWA